MDNTEEKRRIVLVRKRKIIVAKPQHTPSIGCTILKELLPLRQAMIIGLRSRGINTQGLNFKTVVVLYYNEFSGRYINISEFINNFSFRISSVDITLADKNSARNLTAISQVKSVVEVIINIFKTAKDRYDTLLLQGFSPRELMTDEEISQARHAIKVEKELLSNSKKDHFVKASELNHYLIFAIVAGLLFYFLFK
jgi:hypothetical protein